MSHSNAERDINCLKKIIKIFLIIASIIIFFLSKSREIIKRIYENIPEINFAKKHKL